MRYQQAWSAVFNQIHKHINFLVTKSETKCLCLYGHGVATNRPCLNCYNHLKAWTSILENISDISHPVEDTIARVAMFDATKDENRPHLTALASYVHRQIETIPPFARFLDFGGKLNSVVES